MESKKVTMRHPFTNHTVEVENSSEALTPWMVQGYQQVREPAVMPEPPAAPVKE